MFSRHERRKRQWKKSEQKKHIVLQIIGFVPIIETSVNALLINLLKSVMIICIFTMMNTERQAQTPTQTKKGRFLKMTGNERLEIYKEHVRRA